MRIDPTVLLVGSIVIISTIGMAYTEINPSKDKVFKQSFDSCINSVTRIQSSLTNRAATIEEVKACTQTGKEAVNSL